MSYYRLKDITDLKSATLIGSADESKSETFLRLKGSIKLYEVIMDLSGEFATYPDTSYIVIDGSSFSFDDGEIGNYIKTTADIFKY